MKKLTSFCCSIKKQASILGLFLVCSTISLMAKDKSLSVNLLKAGVGYSSTSVNTTSFRNSSITTFRNTQYIAFYDADKYLVLGKRKLGDKKWETRRSNYVAHCEDAHNVISIGVDGDGYLHLSFDQHAQKLKYCRSVAPGSLELTALMPMTGKQEVKVTYPEFHRFTNGDLMFVYRDGSSGNGNMVINHYDLKTKQWKMIQSNLIDGEKLRNAYWQMCVDKNDVIHVSWIWRESPKVETNHDMCYAKSYDKGKTWLKSDGTAYNLPINMASAEMIYAIPQNSELINQTGMAVDNRGDIYIATYWKAKNTTVPQYRLIWHSAKGWNAMQVSHRTSPFSLAGPGTKKIPISRPKVAAKVKNNKVMVYYLYRDVEETNKVSVFYNDDFGKKGIWKQQNLTDFTVGEWEPSYDYELWKSEGKLNVFVQHSAQGDRETVSLLEPQNVYLMDVDY